MEDYYNEGAAIEIPLDSTLNAQENAEKYYEKQKVAKRKLPNVEQQRAAAAEELAHWQAVRDELAGAERLKDLERLAKAHPELSGGQTTRQTPSLPFHAYRFRDHEIWVGRNAKANDRMTFGYAHKEDLWLHAKDVPGSHVVVRRPNKDASIPSDVLEYAAGLAAWHSKLRTNNLVPVGYTRRKYLRKPKRLAPGQVLVDREESILIEPVAPPRNS